MHLSRGAEMLLKQLNQICWEDQQAWIGHHTKLTRSLKCDRNYLLTWKKYEGLLLVYNLEVQYPDQLQNIICSSTNGVEEPRQWTTSCTEHCSEWDGLNACYASQRVSEKASFNL